jgi:hypothetical protein
MSVKSDAAQQAFLQAFATCGIVTHAADIAGVSRARHYEWLLDPEYADAFDQAGQAATDLLVAEARRRATQGTEKAVMYEGHRCYELKPDPDNPGKYTADMDRPILNREYSDSLLMFLIKKADPSYRENSKVEHTGKDGAPLSIEVVFKSPESKEQ